MADNEHHEGTRSLLGKAVSVGKIHVKKGTEETDNFKYLIKDRNYKYLYLKNDGSGATYSSSIGTAIFDKLPKHISEKGDCTHEVIRSDNPKFKEILERELFGYSNVNGLKKQIENLEYQLSIKKKNRDLIIDALNLEK